MAENAKKWLHAHEAPQYLEEAHRVRRSKKTLAKLRCIGGGPEFRKVGRYVIYAPEALDAYAASLISKPLTSTAEYTVSVSAKAATPVTARAAVTNKNDMFLAATSSNSGSASEAI